MKTKKSIQKRSKRVATFLLLGFGIWACQDEFSESSDPNLVAFNTENGLVKANSVKDNLALKVAKNMAANISNPALIEFLNAKASEQFDGDNNFLIEVNRNEPLTSEVKDMNKRAITFGSILTGGEDVAMRTTENVENLLDSIAAYYPLMQVYLYGFPEDVSLLNDEEYLVAFVPSNIQNDVVPAYDKRGNYLELSANEPPASPVIVISENERVLAFPKNQGESNRVLSCPVMAEAIYENEDYIY